VALPFGMVVASLPPVSAAPPQVDFQKLNIPILLATLEVSANRSSANG
jgi:hypothetical protein